MAPRKRRSAAAAAAADQTIYTVYISGKSYEAGVNKRFKVKPTSQRKRGFGYQVRYDIKRPDLRKLTDIMADLAAPEEGPAPANVVEAIYTDLERFPEEAGLC